MSALGSRRWWALAALGLTVLTIGFDATILNVALPTLATALHASTGALQWMVDAYVLVFAGLLLPMGALGDRFGRKRLILVGLVLFGAASVLATYAGSTGPLIAARAIMGIGAAVLTPIAAAVLPVIFPPHDRLRSVADRRVRGLEAAHRPADDRPVPVRPAALHVGHRGDDRRLVRPVRPAVRAAAVPAGGAGQRRPGHRRAAVADDGRPDRGRPDEREARVAVRRTGSGRRRVAGHRRRARGGRADHCGQRLRLRRSVAVDRRGGRRVDAGAGHGRGAGRAAARARRVRYRPDHDAAPGRRRAGRGPAGQHLGGRVHRPAAPGRTARTGGGGRPRLDRWCGGGGRSARQPGAAGRRPGRVRPRHVGGPAGVRGDHGARRRTRREVPARTRRFVGTCWRIRA